MNTVVEAVKIGGFCLAPAASHVVITIALNRFSSRDCASRVLIRGGAMSLSSIITLWLSSKGLYSLPLGIWGLYLQYQGIKIIQFRRELLHKPPPSKEVPNLGMWLERLADLDNDLHALSILKFALPLDLSPFYSIRQEINQLRLNEKENLNKIIELIGKLNEDLASLRNSHFKNPLPR